ncbi:NineTeen Complex (NTC) component [Lunasporangiospora selenospora]|uniref:DNA-directed RNA polymerases I and III subunit RPAC2 n=1 Tax=Lunasporangiospora selenospora TaxID=979761 RepID=A0A9P6KHK0_9FUNG|nr:NineTeen Complex (NTC) component [Lunasporangiospora selenospora]
MSAATRNVQMEEDNIEVDSNKAIIVPGTMTDSHCATICLQDEDHTLGNSLRWALMKNPEVDFASYSIPHPSETRTNVRIQTSEKTTAVEAVFKGLDDLMDLCTHVIDTFQTELAKGEFEAAVVLLLVGASALNVDKIKNKNAAPVQISAEQILREARERQEVAIKVPKQTIHDRDELMEYRGRKRKEFEDRIQRSRLHIGEWLKYAAWEESQDELTRARSIYERALQVDSRNPTLYLKYVEMEMKHKNISLARNLFDRIVTILPRRDQFWLKYTYMEEMLEEVARARQIFERWMQWEPEEEAWMAYVKFEKRYKEFERARTVYERFVHVHPEPKNWIKWAEFEEKEGNLERTREIFGRAIEVLGEELLEQRLFISFARFETRQKEVDRARVIYKYALDRIPRSKSQALYNQYVQFEKQYGNKEGIEDVVVGKRRLQYEAELATNLKNYDTWFDYGKLEESTGDLERVREVYERAIAQVPPAPEKRLWRRYIYLWIKYAFFEELDAKDYERTRQVYKSCLQLIPHKNFTFAKIWLLYAKFEVRQMEVDAARKSLGMALGMCPKDKLFKGYIELELEMRNIDRARKLYSKYLEWSPSNCSAWIKFAELESELEDTERARAIYELAITQPELDMPEILWKAYIDFEVGEEEWANARALYRKLLERTAHVKVYISWAHFEASVPEEGQAEVARRVFEQGYKRLKEQDLKEERVILLEAWKEFEKVQGTEETFKRVQDMMPKMVKRRRMVEAENGSGTQAEEYYDYIFPDDKSESSHLKLLNKAQEWKARMEREKAAKAQAAAQAAAQAEVAAAAAAAAAEAAGSSSPAPEEPESRSMDAGSEEARSENGSSSPSSQAGEEAKPDAESSSGREDN